MTRARVDTLSREVIGAAIEVHRGLGPGLLESAYEVCLCHELASRSIAFQRQAPLPIHYKEVNLDCGYRIDVLVEDCLLIELKSVERFDPIHEAQVLTYLKLSNLWLGLLINFNVKMLSQGIKRLVNGTIKDSL